ncbi:MAG: hypothetical protein WAV41_04940 [Microgenomates group bacterium]
MDIPNLAANQPNLSDSQISFSLPAIILVVVFSIFTGFWLSRFFPPKTSPIISTTVSDVTTVSTDKITDSSQLTVGTVYGNSQKTYKDSATGTVEKGSINGEGTHILIRAGGASQRASLISSSVDLDLFIGKKVEIKGETNASTKTSWLLDVGSIKILE